MNESHELYRYYDKDDSLLYLGISHSTLKRHSQHSKKPWHDQICTIKIERYESRKRLEDAERAAIEEERPEHNVTHNNSVIGLNKERESRHPDAVDLKPLWAVMGPKQRADMAESCITTVAYLSQVCNGHGRPGKAMLKHIANYLEISDPQKIDLSFKPSKPRKKNKAAA